MKVALLTDAPYCRDVRAQRTARALIDAGFSLTVFDQGFETEASRRILPESVKHFSTLIPTDKATRFVWHVKNNLAPRLSLRTANQTAYDVLCESAPSIIHLVNPFLGDAVIRYMGEHPECKLVYEAYEYWPEYLYDAEFGVSRSIRNHLARTEQALLLGCVVFITVSKPIAEFYEQVVVPRESLVVYNVNVRDNTEADQRPVVVGNPLKVVFSGQFAADRNVDMLLQAVKLMRHRISVTLLGRGPQSEQYKQLVGRLDIAKSVVIKNPVPPDELIEELENYDIGVHLVSPQTHQQDGAAPNKIFDYLRANLAIVSVDAKGVKSLGIDECISFVNPLNIESLAQILDDFAENSSRVLSMKQEAARLKFMFTTEHELHKVKSLYKDLMHDE